MAAMDPVGEGGMRWYWSRCSECTQWFRKSRGIFAGDKITNYCELCIQRGLDNKESTL